jgi:hypothetical protein
MARTARAARRKIPKLLEGFTEREPCQGDARNVQISGCRDPCGSARPQSDRSSRLRVEELTRNIGHDDAVKLENVAGDEPKNTAITQKQA